MAPAAASAKSSSSRLGALQPLGQALAFTWGHTAVRGAWSRDRGAGWLRKAGAEVCEVGPALLSPAQGTAWLRPRRGRWVVGGTHLDGPRALLTAVPLLHAAALVTMRGLSAAPRSQLGKP